jgi:hypothetical protein
LGRFIEYPQCLLEVIINRAPPLIRSQLVIALPAGKLALAVGVHPTVPMAKNIVNSNIALRLFFTQDFNKFNMEFFFLQH